MQNDGDHQDRSESPKVSLTSGDARAEGDKSKAGPVKQSEGDEPESEGDKPESEGDKPNDWQVQLKKAEADKLKAEADKLKAEADKLKAEADKLKAETDNLKAEAGKRRLSQWAIRVLAPTALGAIAAAGSSWWFADSLEERTHAEIQREVLKAYFAVENTSGGKRKQILDFVEYVVGEDKGLQKWVRHERPNVDKAIGEAEVEKLQAQEGLAGSRESLKQLEQAEDLFVDLMQQTDVVDSWLAKTKDSPKSVPGDIGMILTGRQNEAMLSLMDKVGADAYSKISLMGGCSDFSLLLKRYRNPETDVGSQVPTEKEMEDVAEKCRSELLIWALTVAGSTRKSLDIQIDRLIQSQAEAEAQTTASNEKPFDLRDSQGNAMQGNSI